MEELLCTICRKEKEGRRGGGGTGNRGEEERRFKNGGVPALDLQKRTGGEGGGIGGRGKVEWRGGVGVGKERGESERESVMDACECVCTYVWVLTFWHIHWLHH